MFLLALFTLAAFSLYFSYLVEMTPKVDMAARRALEAAAAAQQTERKKKRPVVEASLYELKRIRRGPAQSVVRSLPTSSPVAIPEAIPLVGGSTVGPIRPEDPSGSLPESARERIWPALLLGEARRFEIMSLQKLGDWAFCFSNSVSVFCIFPYAFLNIFLCLRS